LKSVSLTPNIRKTDSSWSPNIREGVRFYVKIFPIENNIKSVSNEIEVEQEEDIVLFLNNRKNTQEISGEIK
jgi:hypothetical protein